MIVVFIFGMSFVCASSCLWDNAAKVELLGNGSWKLDKGKRYLRLDILQDGKNLLILEPAANQL
jgi:hypothetical protein